MVRYDIQDFRTGIPTEVDMSSIHFQMSSIHFQMSSIHFQMNPDIFRWLSPAISTVRGFDLMPRLRQKALLPSFRSSLSALGPV